MFKKTWKDWITNTETKKSVDMKFKSKILHQPESIVGAGLLAIGLTLTVYGAWKAGIYDFDRAELAALEEADLLRN